MEDGVFMNNIHWSLTDARLADLYKLFLGDFNSKEEFDLELENIIREKHKLIYEQDKINVAKRYREE